MAKILETSQPKRLLSLPSFSLFWTTCFLTHVADTAFIFVKCQLLTLNPLLWAVRKYWNPDPVIPYISYVFDLVVSHRFDNMTSLSSSESMIKMLIGTCEENNATGSTPNYQCWACLNFIELIESILTLIKILYMIPSPV